MAHNLQERDKQFGLVMAWHGLTNIVEKLTKETAFPWDIQTAPLFRQVEQGYIQHKASEQGKGWATAIASDDGLPVGNGQPFNLDSYSLQTPLDAWQYMEERLNGVDYQTVSALTTGNRSKFAISNKLVELEKIKTADGNEVELVFNFIGSLDKTLPIHLNISSIRVVCENTLMMNFLKTDGFKLRLKHTKNVADKLEANKELVEQAVGYSAVVKATFDSLIKQSCSVDRAQRIYTGFLASEGAEEMSTRLGTLVEQHIECFQRGLGNQGQNEFDLLNGFTQLRTRGYADSKKSAWSTFESSELGSFAREKTEFASLLVERGEPLSKVEARGKTLLATA